MTDAASGGNPATHEPPLRATSGGVAAGKPRRAPRTRTPHPPDTPGLARIIAIANQKGGVGKSTTAVSLGAALAELGYRVLVVDLDPQGNASTGMGIRHEAREATVYDVIISESPITDAVIATSVVGLHALPSTIDLAGAEIELVSQFSRETRLKKALLPVREGVYDFVLLDCPPSLGLLTINALTAAEELIVPIQCEYYALEGLGQLLRNVSLVQQNINADLRLSGIVMTMYDPRTRLSEQVVAEVRRFFGELVYDVIIPRTVRLSEAPGFGQPITVYDPKSKGAECYRELAREVASRPPPSEPIPTFDEMPTVAVASAVGSAARLPIGEDELSDVPTVHDLVEKSADERIVDERTVAATEPVDGEPDVETIHDGVKKADAGTVSTSRREEAPAGVAEDAELEAKVWLEELAGDAHGEPRTTGEILTEAVAGVVEQLDDEDLWEQVEESPSPETRVSVPRSPAPPGQLPQRRVVVIDEGGADTATSEARGSPARQPAEEDGESTTSDIGATLEDENTTRRRRWRMFRKGGE